MIDVMIDQLKCLIVNRAPIISSIARPKLLLQALEELDDMVEMKQAKEAIATQIQFLIINGDLDNHMLHTAIYGPAGTGKTKLGRILAKIWLALGALKTAKQTGVKKKETKKDNNAAILEANNHVMRTKITKINNETRDLRSQIEEARTSLIQIQKLRKPKNKADMLERAITKELDIIQYATRQLKVTTDRIDRNCELLPSMTKTQSIIANLDLAELNPTETEVPISVVSREDLVAGYVGQSGLKTMKVLTENLGKVLFIDEAYSLVNGDHDSFGMDVITCINKFMSEHPHEIIIIFAGYKDMMKETIFKYQPGLERRCAWVFDIEPYSAEALAQIFAKQLKKNGWQLHNNVDLNSFFEKNKKHFRHYGGDTERLAFHCKLAYSSSKFDEVCKANTEPKVSTSAPATTSFLQRYEANLNRGPHKMTEEVKLDNIITKSILNKALEQMISNDANKEDEMAEEIRNSLFM